MSNIRKPVYIPPRIAKITEELKQRGTIQTDTVFPNGMIIPGREMPLIGRKRGDVCPQQK